MTNDDVAIRVLVVISTPKQHRQLSPSVECFTEIQELREAVVEAICCRSESGFGAKNDEEMMKNDEK